MEAAHEGEASSGSSIARLNDKWHLRVRNSIMTRDYGDFRVANRLRRLAIAGLLILLVMPAGNAMEIQVLGDQLLLSGPVVVGDSDTVENRLTAQPQIKMVVLRNSPGGDAPTGYHLGELFRQRSLTTAVINIDGYSTFMCQGTEPDHPSPFNCERIGKTALDLGIATSPTLVRSHLWALEAI